MWAPAGTRTPVRRHTPLPPRVASVYLGWHRTHRHRVSQFVESKSVADEEGHELPATAGPEDACLSAPCTATRLQVGERLIRKAAVGGQDGAGSDHVGCHPARQYHTLEARSGGSRRTSSMHASRMCSRHSQAIVQQRPRRAASSENRTNAETRINHPQRRGMQSSSSASACAEIHPLVSLDAIAPRVACTATASTSELSAPVFWHATAATCAQLLTRTNTRLQHRSSARAAPTLAALD